MIFATLAHRLISNEKLTRNLLVHYRPPTSSLLFLLLISEPLYPLSSIYLSPACLQGEGVSIFATSPLLVSVTCYLPSCLHWVFTSQWSVSDLYPCTHSFLYKSSFYHEKWSVILFPIQFASQLSLDFKSLK